MPVNRDSAHLNIIIPLFKAAEIGLFLALIQRPFIPIFLLVNMHNIPIQ